MATDLIVVRPGGKGGQFEIEKRKGDVYFVMRLDRQVAGGGPGPAFGVALSPGDAKKLADALNTAIERPDDWWTKR